MKIVIEIDDSINLGTEEEVKDLILVYLKSFATSKVVDDARKASEVSALQSVSDIDTKIT